MLGRGLEEAFGDTPAIRIVVHTQETAGLASGDIAALTRDIAETAEKEKMDFAVLMIGANDQRKIKAGDTTFEFRGEGWEDAYKTRIAAVTQALRATGKQTYVVGMPPVADADMNGAFAYFNELFREATFAASARFVDIWTVFLDADGQFTRNGPDIEGNDKQLRWRDGIRFTHAGRRKLAHYVEREIRRDAGLVRGMAALIDGGAAAAPSLYTGPWADRPAIGPVLSLTNPQVILGAPLLGDGNQQEPRDDTPQYHFVVLGEPLQAPVGRVDDFAWPPHQGIEPPAAATPEAPGTPDSAAPDNDAAADVPANGATPATAAVAEKPAEPLADIPIIIDPVPAR
ncbi:MAG: GDSL-type esterase/lipase family protein [Hyphomicrobiales bacterium]